MAELEKLVARHPFQERLHGQLMLALYRAGRQRDALDAYRDARKTLVGELGIEPGPSLQALEQAILRQDPELDLRAPAAAPRGRKSPPNRFLVPALLVAGAISVAAVTLALTTGGGKPGLRVPIDAVGVIDPNTARVVATIPVGTRPGPVSLSSGSVWVANQTDRTLSRVEPRSRKVVRTVPVPAFPGAIAAGRGTLWVADPYTSTVVEVLAQANAVLKTIDLPPVRPGRDPVAAFDCATGNGQHGVAGVGVTVGGGKVWIVCASTLLGVIDPRSARAQSSAYGAGTEPRAVAYGLGSLWIANRPDNTVTQVDPLTLEPLRTITVAAKPSGIAIADGSVWVTDFGSDAVSRISVPGTGLAPTVRTVAVGRGPDAIAAGEGAVWVANTEDRTVSRIDPHRNRVTRTIGIGNVPAGIAAGDGAVWVTVQSGAS